MQRGYRVKSHRTTRAQEHRTCTYVHVARNDLMSLMSAHRGFEVALSRPQKCEHESASSTTPGVSANPPPLVFAFCSWQFSDDEKNKAVDNSQGACSCMHHRREKGQEQAGGLQTKQKKRRKKNCQKPKTTTEVSTSECYPLQLPVYVREKHVRANPQRGGEGIHFSIGFRTALCTPAPTAEANVTRSDYLFM